MSYLRKTLAILLCALLFAPLASQANDELDGELVSELLQVAEAEKFLVYGEYAEVEITAQEAITLDFLNDVKAYGMELEATSEKNLCPLWESRIYW